ncbi:hypothetical protein [Sphingomonas alba]|uniref:Uncharacterized protein n=1 Tax=Sphingomonas alba TaxID=2908208 RepID=A0ABT0RQ10_9SPHN|nr:hypothetical protein [Sphingomonas alba]MCL6684635.1 hypothetical protein [Sphingomonas alba]
MTESRKNDEADKRSVAWLRWELTFWPVLLTAWLAERWFGFTAVMIVLAVVAVGALGYQRLVNRRSWQSILRGDRASKQ